MMAGVPATGPRFWTHVASPDEIESRDALDARLRTGSLAGATVQGVRLDVDPPDLRGIDVTNVLFVGCRFPDTESAADVVRRGGSVVPIFEETPYPSSPAHLYTPTDLAAGFAESGFDAMFDTVVYRHYLTHGGPQPDVREALGQRIHDAGIDDALADELDRWVLTHPPSSVVGVMGGHAEPRGSHTYRLAAELGCALAGADRLVVTGGGPGVMEAANLGAYLSGRTPDERRAAIDELAVAPDFRIHQPYTGAALEVRRRYPPTGPSTDRVRGGLAIPTWLYGHEPANLFAAGIAKYFSNAIREDTILRVARGGIVFAPGWAGTVQEVFQAATRAFYRPDGPSGPLVFLGVNYWTTTVPVQSLLRPLLAASPHGDVSGLVRLTDDVSEAVAVLTSG